MCKKPLIAKASYRCGDRKLKNGTIRKYRVKIVNGIRQPARWIVMNRIESNKILNKIMTKQEMKNYRIIPCGQCEKCKLDRSAEWQTRAFCEEIATKEPVAFITLTYNDKHLPKDGKCKKEHMQKFIAKLRESERRRGRIIRPMHAGEIGPKTGRAHYHCAIFGIKIDDLEYFKTQENGEMLFKSKRIQSMWGKGFITIGTVNNGAAGYVAKYTAKKRDNGNGEYLETPRRPGLGRQYYEIYKHKIFKDREIEIRTKQGIKIVSIPTYFKNIYRDKETPKYYRYLAIKYYEDKAYEKWNEKVTIQAQITDEYNQWWKRTQSFRERRRQG
ncbi:MAG: replication initiator protein [Microvirus sp.]|nr:MAG: replication initiator protein [Microvirus sp.]